MTRPSDAAIALKPCPFCKGEMMFRKALWPSDGNTDAIIHAVDSGCGLVVFDTGTTDESVIDAWNRRAIDAEAKDVPAEVGAVVAALKRRFSEIEDEIAANRTTAPQVFTWMRTAALAAIASAPTAPNEGERHGS